ncbi:MAG: recombinase family protein [Actinomycetota bacterium]
MQLDAYVRVSDVHGRSGESFISPTDQRERIEAWARSQKHQIGKVFEELDVSGGTTNRPMLNEVMRRIEAGETGGVVVAKLDRFGRTLVGSLELIKRIQDKGALFASVADNFDISTANGRLVLNMMLSIAQFELERISDSWSTARARATQRGVHLGARPPAGYLRREDGGLEPDPVYAPIVAEMFQRRAIGDSLGTIRGWLHDACPLTPRGKPWTISVVQRVMGNEVYLGRLHDKMSGSTLDGAHPPLIDPATFHAVQGQRGARRAPSAESNGVLLRGLVRCASCRYTMLSARQAGTPPAPAYQCRRQAVARDCPHPTTIRARTHDGTNYVGLDAFVVEQVFAELPRIDALASTKNAELERVNAEAKAARAELDTYASDREAERAAGRQAYLAGLEARRVNAEAKEARRDEVLRRNGNLEQLLPMREHFDSLSISEQRDALASLIQAVFVRPYLDKPSVACGEDGCDAPAHSFGWCTIHYNRRYRANGYKGPDLAPGWESWQGASASRIHIVWFDDPPLDVPRQGRRDYVARPFVFPGDSDGPGRVGKVVA